MSQHALDLGMLQEQISSPSRHERCAGQKQLSDDGRIAVGSVETDQRHFWWKREVLQISRDGPQGRSQFPAIVAIALARIRPDPLARVHLKRCGARAHHLPTLASSVARSTDRIESAFGSRQGRIAGQGALPCSLACRINVKDQIAAPLSIEDAANGFRCPAFRERLLLEERAEGFQTRTIDIGNARDSNWSDEEDIGVQRAP